jgi:hypothetical protein
VETAVTSAELSAAAITSDVTELILIDIGLLPFAKRSRLSVAMTVMGFALAVKYRPTIVPIAVRYTQRTNGCSLMEYSACRDALMTLA